jgi:hypothetical protein
MKNIGGKMKIDKNFLLESILKEIPINIWDDYLDDEDYKISDEAKLDRMKNVEKALGEFETYAYVESDEISVDIQKKALTLIGEYMKANNYNVELIKKEKPKDYMEIGWRYQLNIKGLSHENREKLVKDLEKMNLKINGDIPLRIYSES